MNMNIKKEFLCAIIALSLISCDKNDDIQSFPEAIDFNVYSGLLDSKALDKSKFDIGDMFKVSAFQHKGDLATQQKFNANFFENIAVTATGTDGNPSITAWAYDNEKYWPTNKDEYLSFVATYAKTKKKTEKIVQTPDDITVTTEGKVQLADFIVDDAAANQVDLLWAGVPNKQYVAGDDAIRFTFKHALSRILFTASKAADYNNVTITITSLTIADVIKKGTYEFGKVSTGVTAWGLGRWIFAATSTEKHTYSPFIETNVTEEVTHASKYLGESLLIIPQEATNKKIQMSYEVKNIATGDVIEMSVAIIPTTEWVQNHQYTYNLMFNLDGVTFETITIAGWESVPNGDIIIPSTK